MKLLCDEFAIRGFSFDIAHRVAEALLQHLDVAPIPGLLDGVADGSLEAGGEKPLRHPDLSITQGVLFFYRQVGHLTSDAFFLELSAHTHLLKPFEVGNILNPISESHGQHTGSGFKQNADDYEPLPIVSVPEIGQHAAEKSHAETEKDKTQEYFLIGILCPLRDILPCDVELFLYMSQHAA